MEQAKESMKQLKWVVLAGVIVAILVALITANFHVLQFMQYKMKNDSSGMVKTLSSSVSARSQKEWYFKQGMNYLLRQDEYTDEMKTFFEENFNVFNEAIQKEIITGYSKQGISMPMNKDIMNFLVKWSNEDAVKNYIKSMTPEDLENGLVYVYGTKPEVNDKFVADLDQMLMVYPKKLPFNKFKFSLYGLLALQDEQSVRHVKTIMSKIEPQTARTDLFGELKTKEITEEQLVGLVKLLKEVEIITLSESNQYDTLYSELCMARSQYQGMDEETITLKNKKESVEAQILETSNKLKEKETQINNVQSQINEIESKLESLTNYAYMPLYIERSSGTGSNEYIASVPRGGLFGILKPSDQKYIVKLMGTSFLKEGVYNLNVYLQGSKEAADGAQYAYYVEVSGSDISQMEGIAADKESKIAALNELKKDAATMQETIDKVKKENNYDEVVQSLESVDSRRNEYINKINEKVAAIKDLFGFSKLTINIDPQ